MLKRFDVLTIFPDLFDSPLQEGIIRRALARKQIEVNLYNIRDWTLDKHSMTDDRPFGGGEGMVMKPEPLSACLQNVQTDSRGKVILLSPRGKVFNQKTAERLAEEKNSKLILICGRYEGVDERFCTQYVDEEISIGDYILTGGELAAMVIIDSVTRLLPGVLGCKDSAANDTFSRGLLKHSQYTRPRIFENLPVPEILLSGDHKKISEYRFLESVRETLARRPELLSHIQFTEDEKKILKKAKIYNLIKKEVITSDN